MKQWLRRLLWGLAFVFVGLNAIAFRQAWQLTHFTDAPGPRPHPGRLSATERLWLVLAGLPNPRPRTEATPAFAYQAVQLPGPDGPLAAWYAAPPAGAGAARGTVALFHGYGSSKSKLLYEAGTFRELGYAVLLVDQPGSGDSAGRRTSIGYYEAGAVAEAARYLRRRSPGRPLVLYGVSMGAAAIMRAEAELGVRPTANILECPYGTMRQTVLNRFQLLGVPAFPVADLLVFWGGLQNGFWAYGLQPEEFARRITTPTLLLWGTADTRVTPAETDRIFAHLAGPRRRVNFVGSGHQSYWRRYPRAWRTALASWLSAQGH